MSVVNTGFTFLDFSHLLEVAPRQNTLVTNMELFVPEYHQTDICEVKKVSWNRGAIPGRLRGGERNFIQREDAVAKQFKIPFYPLDGAIQAGDVQNFVSYADPNAPKTVEDVVMRRTSMIQKTHQEQREKLMVQAIMGTGGDASTGTYNYFTVWGQTQTTVPVAFSSTTIDPLTTIEEQGRSVIIDKAGNGADGYSIVVLCSRTWFQKLSDNPFVKQAYDRYASTQEPLRERLGGDLNNRYFVHKGYTFMEDISGYIPAGEAYMFPRGIEGMFSMHFAPADHVAFANTTAREAYLFLNEVKNGRSQMLETESSVLCVNSRPELVIKLTSV